MARITELVFLLILFSAIENSNFETYSIYELSKEDIQIFSLYNILIDLRHIYYYDGKFQYGLQWTIYLNFSTDDISIDLELLRVYPQPTGFFSSSTTPFYFNFMPVSKGTLTITIERENTYFKSQLLSFKKCVSVSVLTPSRSSTSGSLFMSVIDINNDIGVPENIFYATSGLTTMANKFMISSLADISTVNARLANLKTDSTLNSNLDYNAVDRKKGVLPYLPFFMNCGDVGNYIFLSDLFENPKYCKFISPEDTVVVGNLNFGAVPTADTCNSTFKCIFDVDVTQINLSTSDYWFLANANKQLFSIYSTPVDYDSYKTFLLNLLVNPEDFIQVSVGTTKQTNKIPTIVDLNIGYKQLNTTTKKIIEASVMFSGFITPTSKKTQYNLNVNIRPLKHTELTMAFALNWKLYLIFFIGTGAAFLMISILFFIYHRIFIVFPDFKIYFFSYFNLIIKPMILGVGLAALLQMIYLLIASFLFLHKIMRKKFVLYNCAITDSICKAKTIWDVFMDSSITTDDVSKVRDMRFSMILLQSGLYMIYQSTKLLIPKNSNDFIERQTESFDKNILRINFWKRTNYLMILGIFIIYELYLIFFSFTQLFADNIWVFIFIYKIAGMVLEEILMPYVKCDLQMLTFAATLNFVEGLCTCGATSVLDFVQGNFLSLAMLMVERAYAKPVTEFVSHLSRLIYSKIVSIIKAITQKNTSNGREYEVLVNNNDKAKSEEDMNMNFSEDSSASDILISNYSFEDNLVDDFVDDIDSDGEDKSDEDGLSVSMKKSVTSLKSKKSTKNWRMKGNRNQSISFKFKKTSTDSKSNKDENNKAENKILKSVNHKENNDKNRVSSILYENNNDFTAAADKYSLYANQTIGLLYLPISFWIIWSFYTEINIAASWGIKEFAFLYYVIYSIVIIPFQIFIDIFFYNIEAMYNGLNFKMAMERWRLNFINRQNDWIGFDHDDVNLQYEKRQLFKQCFSAQNQFIVTICVAGILATILGFVALTNSGFIPFNDKYLIFILFVNQVLLMGLTWLFLKLRLLLRIWVCKKPYGMNMQTMDDISKNLDDHDENLRLLVYKERLTIERNPQQESEYEDRVRKENIIKEFMSKEFEDKLYHKKFFEVNRLALRDRLEQIFSPNTVIKKRFSINESFLKVFGELKMPLEREDVKLKGQKGLNYNSKDKDKLKKRITPQNAAVLRYWYHRARTIRISRSQIAGILEKKTNVVCDYCGINWGLRCECIDNIEAIFEDFKKTKYFVKNTYTLFDWQKYFYLTAKTRTLCFRCVERIVLQF